MPFQVNLIMIIILSIVMSSLIVAQSSIVKKREGLSRGRQGSKFQALGRFLIGQAPVPQK